MTAFHPFRTETCLRRRCVMSRADFSFINSASGALSALLPIPSKMAAPCRGDIARLPTSAETTSLMPARDAPVFFPIISARVFVSGFKSTISVSVGSVGTTNEGCKPGESQGSSGKHPGNTHGRCSISEASSPSLCSTAGRAAGSSPDPMPDTARRQPGCDPRRPASGSGREV